nr:phosphatase PAP2 family protein [Tissierella sp.]
MNEEIYKKISGPIKRMNRGEEILNIINKTATSFVYLTYPVILLLLAIKKDIRFWKVLIIPAVSFIIVSLIRKWIDFPRPYEVLDIDPIIKKETKGNSFPSRHVFSVFIIAMILYYIVPSISLLLIFIGFIIAVTRVVGGVHFPRDVIAGALIGIVLGIIGWKLLNI